MAYVWRALVASVFVVALGALLLNSGGVRAARNQTGPQYDQLALFGSLAALECDERVFFPQAGSWDPWDGDIDSDADTPLIWEDYVTDFLEGQFSTNYATVLGTVNFDKLNDACFLHATTQYLDYKAQSNGVFHYNSTAQYQDFVQLYKLGLINVNTTLNSSGLVSDSSVPLKYNQTFSVGAFLRVDVQPDGWFNPSIPYYFQNATLRESYCGPSVTNAWDCFFSPTTGVFNAILTGLLVAADVRSNVTFSDGEQAILTSQGGVPMLVGLVGRRLPWRAPFCGVPVPLF